MGRILRALSRNKPAAAGLMVVLSMFALSILAPRIATHGPDDVDVTMRLKAPGVGGHILGTDRLGRDVFSRMIWGSRVSLKVGFVAVGIAVLIGVILGSLAGFYGGWLDSLIMRFCDLMLCFPTIFLILAVITLLEPSIWNVMLVIGLTGWMSVTRFVRAELLSLKNRDFVWAARNMGASDLRVITSHLLPNAMGPVFVTATLGVAGAILTESTLSFLGLGVQAPMASWGSILADGKQFITSAWWLTFYPGLAILITVLSYNLLGEGLREFLNPHARGEKLN